MKRESFSLEEIMALKHNSQLTDIMHKFSCDFLTSNAPGDWYFGAVASGTISNATIDAGHPGVAVIYSSLSANSGYRYYIGVNSILLEGGEKTTCIFKTAAVMSAITTRFGFHDSADHGDPVDGVYVTMVDDVDSKHYIAGQTANNSTRSTTATKYELAANTWYKVVIELNSDATLATFTLYASDNTVLWTDALSENIPKTAGRVTGHGFTETYATGGVITMGRIDYFDMVLPFKGRVA